MADRCPWCGAEELGSAAWKCYTVKGALGMHRTSNCRAIESKNLRARIARLEAALKAAGEKVHRIEGRTLGDDVLLGDVTEVVRTALTGED